MPGPLRSGRALLQRILSTSPSNLQHSVSSECLQTVVSACVRTAEKQPPQPALLLRVLGNRSWAAAFGDVEKCQDKALDADALQTRRISGSSASTSSSYIPPPAAGRTGDIRRHFSSSRDSSSGPVKEHSPSVKARPSRRYAAEQQRQSTSQRGRGPRSAATSASLAGAAGGGSESASYGAHEGKRHAEGERNSSAAMSHSGNSFPARGTSAQQPNHRASRGRDREAPPEATKSKRTRQLEAMAAEMLREDDPSSAQPAAPPKQMPAGQLGFPAYKQVDERAAAFLKSGDDKLPLELLEKNKIAAHLNLFAKSAKMRNAALALYVNAQLFPIAAQDFKQWIMRGVDERLRDALMAAELGEAEDALFNLFARFVLANFNDQIKTYSKTIKMLDLRKPHLWYPVARALQRRLVYHKGPTNSGKTYNALRAMRSAASGVYCGPLRLLAMEVYDELNAAGTHCNLTTGQERSVMPTAQHTACTIEMTNLVKRVDVAVIDEIQQIGDDQRGWAWTRALQGVPANEIHLCGDGSALPLIRRMAAEMNEPLEVHEYQRFTPLMVESGGLARGYLDVQPGDCVVAFSRKDIYSIKQLIEAGTGQRVCVVYGALPPEMRRTQARLFNDPDSGYDVLVASDAVGMGLNLNIRRIIFHTLTKFENGFRVPISMSQIKQIGGRAGRRSSQFGMGLVTCLNATDTERLQEALDAPMEAMSTDSAGIFPEFEQLEAFAGAQLEDSFHSILKRFAAEAQIDGTYMFCKQDSVIQAAKFLSNVSELSLQERFWFCMAPANLRNPVSAAALKRFAQKYAAREPVGADIQFSKETPTTSEEMCEMEAVHQVISLWIWLSYRFPEEYFPGRDNAVALSDKVIGYMSEGLERMFGPTAAIVNPQARRAACEKLATWTNGAKDASEMAELVAGPDVKLATLWSQHKVQRGTQLEVA